MKLSIVIPTFNRNEHVRRSVGQLLPQLREGVELIVLDNASTVPVATTLESLAVQDSCKVRVVRNPFNLGAYANILRSFEVARGQWLWILGDDDDVVGNAVDLLMAQAGQADDCVWINFCTEDMRLHNLRTHAFDSCGQAEFIEKLDYPGNVNFMSVGLWQKDRVTSRIGISYHYAYSMSPTFTLLLSALGENGRCRFCDAVLIGAATTVEVQGRWRFRDFILGWNTILELPMQPQSRARLAQKMYSWHKPENVVTYLLADAAKQGVGSYYYLLAARKLATHVGWWARVRFCFYRLLFLAPGRTWPMVRWAVKLAIAVKAKHVNVQDIEGRAEHSADDRR